MSPRVGGPPAPTSLKMRTVDENPVQVPVGDGVKRTPVPDLRPRAPAKTPFTSTWSTTPAR